jgi:hypothetical protein
VDAAVEDSADEIRRLGGFYDKLIGDGSWIRRRVDTIGLLDRDRVEHKVTLDVDNERLRQIAAEFGLDAANEVAVPLEHIKKELQLDLDVRDKAGAPLPVTLSDEDSKMAYGLVLAAMMRHKIDPDKITARIHSQLFRMAQRPSLDVLKDITERAKTPGYKSKKGVERVQLDGPDIAQWRMLLSIDEIFYRLLQLAQSYFLSATIPTSDSGVSIVKFRYVEVPETVGAPFLFQNLGFGSPQIYVPAPGVGTAQREHTRVQAPEGSLLSRAKLVSNDGGVGSTDEDVPEGKYGKRESHERAVVYTSRLSARSTYGVVIRVVPALGYFYFPAWVSTFVLTGFLGLAIYVQTHGHYLTRQTTNADAVFAMLGLVPTLISAYLIRAGEHQIVARLQFVPRALLFLAALSAVFVGGAIAIKHPALPLILNIAIIANVLVLTYLSVAIAVIWAQSRRRRVSTFPDLAPAPT